MTTTQQAVARRQSNTPTVSEFIGELVPEIQRALPKGMDGDRIARLALTVVRKDRALAECNPYSFAGALLTAAALGLEVGTGEAHLVAYKGECTFIPDYKGLSKLFYQHPLARHLDAQTVYENDEFDYAYGLDPYLTHKPTKGERGKIVYYYAVAALSTGAKAFVVLTPDEVKALRGGKVGPAANFKGDDPMHWMERKTVLKQLMKLLPKSTVLQQALAADEKTGSELAREREIESAPAPALEAPPAGVDDQGVVVDGELLDDETGGADPSSDVTCPPAAEPGGRG